MYRNNALNKMLLLPPEVYDKLKNDIDSSINKSLFDKAMNKILKDKKLSDKEKWYNYRNELIKFLNLKRRSRHVSETRPRLHIPQGEKKTTLKSLRDSTTQTRLVFKDDMSTQTSPMKEKTPLPMVEDIFEDARELTPPRRSLSPAAKRRLSASGIAKTLRPLPKIPKIQDKDYRVITADDGITQYTVPMDMGVDEAASYMMELEQNEPEERLVAKRPILRPSQLDPGQYMLSFPVRKAARQSERLKSKKERALSVPDIAWERI